MYGPRIDAPTVAVTRITLACICGSDLWPDNDMPPQPTGRPMGHESLGVVEEVGADVRSLRRGQLVTMPFAYSDGGCEICAEGFHTACRHGGFFGMNGMGGAQAEALRVPQADGTLYALPGEEDEALLASLMTLSDVMGTGHHAAVVSHVAAGKRVAAIGECRLGLVRPGGPAPVRAYLDALLPDVMEGCIAR